MDDEWQIFPDDWLEKIGLKTSDEPSTETTTTATVTTTTATFVTSPIVTPSGTPASTPVSTPRREPTPVKQTARKSAGGKAQAGQLQRQNPQDPEDTEVEPTDTEPDSEYPYFPRAAKRPAEVEGYYQEPDAKCYKFSKTKTPRDPNKPKLKKGDLRPRPKHSLHEYVMRSIRRWQRHQGKIIAGSRYKGLVREVLQDVQLQHLQVETMGAGTEFTAEMEEAMKVNRMTAAAYKTLQEVGETYMVMLLSDCYPDYFEWQTNNTVAQRLKTRTEFAR